MACRKSVIPRSELFITTKLCACHGCRNTLLSIEESLKKLNLDYIDLLLIHEPTGDVHEIYRAMETAYKDGNLRAIGISNFLGDCQKSRQISSAGCPAVLIAARDRGYPEVYAY